MPFFSFSDFAHVIATKVIYDLQCYLSTHFEIKDLGPLNYFFGLQIHVLLRRMQLVLNHVSRNEIPIAETYERRANGSQFEKHKIFIKQKIKNNTLLRRKEKKN